MGGGLLGYLRRQYGYGYGRLDLIAKHPTRYGGDDVSGPRMLHAAGATVALGALGATPFLALVGVPPPLPLALSGGVVAVLAAERLLAGLRAWRRFGDPAALLFPVAHLGRDLAWAAAIAVWLARRLARRSGRPEHGMWRGQPGPASP